MVGTSLADTVGSAGRYQWPEQGLDLVILLHLTFLRFPDAGCRDKLDFSVPNDPAI